jgi:ribosomal protein S18 acetylase RimI-like enzyme
MHATASVSLQDDSDENSASDSDDGTDPDSNSESEASDATDSKADADTYVPSTEEFERMLIKVQAAAQAQPRLSAGALCDKDMVFTEELFSNVDPATLRACVLLSAASFRYKPDFLEHDFDDFYNAWYDDLDYTQVVETMLAPMRAGRKYKDKADFEECVDYLLCHASQRAVLLTGRSAGSQKICCACKLTYHNVGSIHDATPTYHAHLSNVCASPVSRGHGRRLMQHVKIFCNKQPDMQSVTLCVDKDEYMYGTLKFYNSVGFKLLPEKPGRDNVFMSYQCTPHMPHTPLRMKSDADAVAVVHMLNPWHMQQHDDLQRQHAGMAASQHTRDILDYMSQERRIARKSP